MLNLRGAAGNGCSMRSSLRPLVRMGLRLIGIGAKLRQKNRHNVVTTRRKPLGHNAHGGGSIPPASPVRQARLECYGTKGAMKVEPTSAEERKWESNRFPWPYRRLSSPEKSPARPPRDPEPTALPASSSEPHGEVLGGPPEGVRNRRARHLRRRHGPTSALTLVRGAGIGG